MRNRMALTLFMLCGGFAYQCVSAEVSTAPAWAYPMNPPPSADERQEPAPSTLRHVPGSTVAISNAVIFSLFSAADWHPEEHVTAPEVVLHGRPPTVFACGVCHRMTGSGGPENASLAGLPEAYILSQLDDYRTGARSTTVPKRVPQAFMIALAKALTPEDARAAAQYFSAQKAVAHIRVTESSQAPRTHVHVWALAADAGDGQEPLGRRIIELPDRPEDFESRDSHATFTAYVPLGSIAAGSARMRTPTGPGAPACVSCHGVDLRGLGLAPPLAGRSPLLLDTTARRHANGCAQRSGCAAHEGSSHGVDAGRYDGGRRLCSVASPVNGDKHEHRSLKCGPHEFWQELLPPDEPQPRLWRDYYAAPLRDGRRIILPLRDYGTKAFAGLVANQASFAVVDTLAQWIADDVAPVAPDLVVGLPTLGHTVGAAVARALGHTNWVAPGTTRKLWYDEALSIPTHSVTSPAAGRSMWLDPRLLDRLSGRRVLLVDDVVTTGSSARAGLALLARAGIVPVAFAVAMTQGEEWRSQWNPDIPGICRLRDSAIPPGRRRLGSG